MLGPPRVSSDSKKNKFSRKIRPYFNGLIKKIESVIKFRFGVRFWRGDAHFHTQSVLFTVMSQFENSQQRQNFGKIVLTSLDSRGFEWHKRVSNLVGTDVGSLRTLQWTLR